MKTNVKWTVLLAGFVLATQAPCARADDVVSRATNAAPAVLPLTPQQFVNDATAGNLKEIYLSELALDRCTNAAIQHFAEHMIRDHRVVNGRLAKIAQAEGLTCLSSNLFRPDDPAWSSPELATEPPAKGLEARMLISTNVPYDTDYRAVQAIKPLTGAEFQDAYITEINDDHVAAVSEYEIAAQTLSDEKLKSYAEKTLPTLRRHLEMVQHLKSLEFESANTNLLSQSQSQPYRYSGMP